MKNKLKNHLYYNWFVYIIIAAVVGALDFIIVRNIIALKEEEKVSIFICTSDCDEQKIKDAFFEAGDENLKEVNVMHYSPLENDVGLIIQSAGTVDTDFIIMPSNKMADEYIYTNCVPMYNCLDEINDIYDFEYVKYSNNIMGIEVFNKEKHINLFRNFITYNDDSIDFDSYVLLFNQASVNMASVKGSGKTDNAIKGLRKLLSYEN